MPVRLMCRLPRRLRSCAPLRPITPALADAQYQVLGEYGYTPSSLEVGKGLEALATSPGTIDIPSYSVLVGWSVMIMIWLSFVSF